MVANDRQHGAHAVGRAVRTPTIDALELTDCRAPRTHLRQQALLSGVAGVGRVGKGVEDAFGPEVAPAARRGVVAGAGRRRPGLEVLGQRVAFAVDERLAEQTRANDGAVHLDERSVSLRLQAGNLRGEQDDERVGDACQHRDDEQGANGRDVLPYRERHPGHGDHPIPGMN